MTTDSRAETAADDATDGAQPTLTSVVNVVIFVSMCTSTVSAIWGGWHLIYTGSVFGAIGGVLVLMCAIVMFFVAAYFYTEVFG